MIYAHNKGERFRLKAIPMYTQTSWCFDHLPVSSRYFSTFFHQGQERRETISTLFILMYPVKLRVAVYLHHQVTTSVRVRMHPILHSLQGSCSVFRVETVRKNAALKESSQENSHP
jgi:hypothetical protein